MIAHFKAEAHDIDVLGGIVEARKYEYHSLFCRDACGSRSSWSWNRILVWWCIWVQFQVWRQCLEPDKVPTSLVSWRGGGGKPHNSICKSYKGIQGFRILCSSLKRHIRKEYEALKALRLEGGVKNPTPSSRKASKALYPFLMGHSSLKRHIRKGANLLTSGGGMRNPTLQQFMRLLTLSSGSPQPVRNGWEVPVASGVGGTATSPPTCETFQVIVFVAWVGWSVADAAVF